MKKTILAFSVAIVFASCNGVSKKWESEKSDSTIVDSSVVVVNTATVAVDSTTDTTSVVK